MMTRLFLYVVDSTTSQMNIYTNYHQNDKTMPCYIIKLHILVNLIAFTFDL